MTAHELIERCAQMLEERDARGLEDYLANEIRALKSTIPNGVVCDAEPVMWMESPYGEIRVNRVHKHTFPPQSLDWQIPLYRAKEPT